MTWGEVDSTPNRLDEATGRTPLVTSFRLPSPSKREALAHQLADKVGRQRAKGRAEAMRLAKSGFGILNSPKLALSPAARRLLSSSTASSSSGASLAFGGRPNSSVRAVPSTSTTPRRTPSDIGVIRRPPTASTNKPSANTSSVEKQKIVKETSNLQSPADLTKDLLNLSGPKNTTSPSER